MDFLLRRAGKGARAVRTIGKLAWASVLAAGVVLPLSFAQAADDAAALDDKPLPRTVGAGPHSFGSQGVPDRPSDPVYVPVVLIPIAQPTVPRFSTSSVAAALRAIEAYKQIQAAGGWPVLADGLELWKGVKGKQVLLLRDRLRISGDLTEVADRPKVYDDGLTMAVAKFQARHGLMTTGFVGPDTLLALNVPVADRIHQLELNIHRLVELQALPAGRSIIVNIPSQELEATENGQLASRHRVVAGKVDRQTPLFQSAVNLIEFNPTWNVPTSIARKDLVPLIQTDAQYLTDHNFIVFDDSTGQRVAIDPSKIDWNNPNVANRYRLVQGRGGKNPLGSMVLRFPNPYDVYMHDTSHPELFTRTSRLNSSGCIRIQGVDQLVTWLLDGIPGWDAARVQETAANVEAASVHLPKPVPVRTIYVTAWADPDGTVQFREDVYTLDQAPGSGLQTSSIVSPL